MSNEIWADPNNDVPIDNWTQFGIWPNKDMWTPNVGDLAQHYGSHPLSGARLLEAQHHTVEAADSYAAVATDTFFSNDPVSAFIAAKGGIRCARDPFMVLLRKDKIGSELGAKLTAHILRPAAATINEDASLKESLRKRVQELYPPVPVISKDGVRGAAWYEVTMPRREDSLSIRMRTSWVDEQVLDAQRAV